MVPGSGSRGCAEGQKIRGGGWQKVGRGNSWSLVRISSILYHIIEGLRKRHAIWSYGIPVVLNRAPGSVTCRPQQHLSPGSLLDMLVLEYPSPPALLNQNDWGGDRESVLITWWFFYMILHSSKTSVCGCTCVHSHTYTHTHIPDPC